jgi:acyl carrier protein
MRGAAGFGLPSRDLGLAKTAVAAEACGMLVSGGYKVAGVPKFKRPTRLSMNMLDEVKGIIAKQVEVPLDQLTADTRLADVGIESLDVIEIVFALEEKFDISIPFNANESAAEAFETIGAVADAVQKLVDAKAA